MTANHHILTFAGLFHLEFIRAHPLGPGKTEGCLGGIPRLVKSGCLRRAGDLDSMGFLLFGHILNQPDQPSRCGHGLDGSVGRPLIRQGFTEHGRHRLQGWLDVTGWNLLSAYF